MRVMAIDRHMAPSSTHGKPKLIRITYVCTVRQAMKKEQFGCHLKPDNSGEAISGQLFPWGLKASAPYT